MKRNVHYVLSTHWDREWHHSFQDFRYRLVRLIDRVLDGWQNEDLQGPFQTDGQAIIIEDYLEVRPEKRDQIAQLARNGKFIIGPWYVMPDEFTVSGESLVRNLRMGRDVARAFGAVPSSAGFMCDMFGHNSQMPQIFSGFNIPGAFIWRGTNTLGKRNILWQGADGTTIPCIRFGEVGYCDYAVTMRMQGENPCGSVPADSYFERLNRYIQEEALHTDVDPILAFDGCDHLLWDEPGYAHLLERMNQTDENFEIVHTNLDQYLLEMVPQKDRITTHLSGELREPGLAVVQPGQDPFESDAQWLIPGVLSSRVKIKQANRVCESQLCQWAEPFSAFASAILSTEYPRGFLNVAWKWLIQNHPHDSIDGCSIDQVHRDMQYRFDQSRAISNRLTLESTRRLAASVQGGLSDQELRITVFNPLSRPIDQVVDLNLQIPTSWPTFNEFFGFEPKPAFRIYAPNGKELPYQRLGQTMNRTRMRMPDSCFPETVSHNFVNVALPLTIPSYGYTTLVVRSGYPGEITRHPITAGLATGEARMENEFLAIEFQSNGSLSLTDKRTQQRYQRLLTFEDIADIGDGWFHGQAINDQAFTSTASSAEIALVHNGPFLTTFRVRTHLSIPEEFSFASMQRADRFTEMVIDNLVTLRAGMSYVEVKTILTNTAGDHRLRVLFPSGAKAETYLADSQFDVVERTIPLRSDNHLYRELEVETKPQQSWTAVFDHQRGLAIISNGLLETAIRDQPDKPLALTLFRATRRTVGTPGEPDGQLFGDLSFDYWIAPLSGQPDRSGLCQLGQLITAGLRPVQLQAADVRLYKQPVELPAEGNFLQVKGDVVVTSFRQEGSSRELRLFNPNTQPTTVQFMGGLWHPASIVQVDLESHPISPSMPFVDGMDVTIEAKKINTFRLE